MKHKLKILSIFDHITAKIWMATVAVTLAVLLVIGFLTTAFYQKIMTQISYKSAVTTNADTTNVLSDTLYHIRTRFVEIFGTKEFLANFPTIRDASVYEYSAVNNYLQDYLTQMEASSSLIQSAVLINRQNCCFHSFFNMVKPGNTQFTLQYPEDRIENVTFLPSMEGPIRASANVIALAFPMEMAKTEAFVAVSPSGKNAELILYLLIDTDEFNSFLHSHNKNNSDSVIYLMSKTGTTINPVPMTNGFSSEPDPELAAMLADQFQATPTQGGLNYPGYLITYNQLSDLPYYIVTIVPKQELSDTLHSIQEFLLVTGIVSILLITISAFFTVIYTTSPLRKVISSVQSIEHGSYDSKQMLKQTDEIGSLSQAIDSMYNTIQHQIEEINTERQAKFNAELRLYAEQINPHFLYNTLEYINMEVSGGNNENAAYMIQNLGDFLRIGLNFGNEQISIEKELSHVEAYINIMDHRFCQKILFSTEVDPELTSYQILKIILQPFVENSIRHGFCLDENIPFPVIPTIRITVTHDDSWLYISVIDNGAGIDIDRAKKILYTSIDNEHHQHVGMNNVYNRLMVFYNHQVSISFQSIPYFENTVLIQIPYQKIEPEDRVGGRD